jgi:hypothetical protein
LITLCLGGFLLWGCHSSTYKVRFLQNPHYRVLVLQKSPFLFCQGL